MAQPRFGFEILSSRLKTENNGHLVGGASTFYYYEIDRELDPTTYSFTAGAYYILHERHLLKLRIGRHRNGRILDLRAYDDIGSTYTYSGADNPYQYFVLAPSYTYRLLNKKFIIPLEIGLQMNESVQKHEIGFVGVDLYNFDMAMSAGLQYRIANYFIIGLHGKYIHYLSEYQWGIERGTFKPRQYGMELSLMYEL